MPTPGTSQGGEAGFWGEPQILTPTGDWVQPTCRRVAVSQEIHVHCFDAAAIPCILTPLATCTIISLHVRGVSAELVPPNRPCASFLHLFNRYILPVAAWQLLTGSAV